MNKLVQYYTNLKPLHLFLFGTVFMLLARVVGNNSYAEIACLFVSLIVYILALVKYIKK